MATKTVGTKQEKQEWAELLVDQLVRSDFHGKVTFSFNNGHIDRAVQERVAVPPCRRQAG